MTTRKQMKTTSDTRGFETRGVANADGTYTFPLSSEEPYRRWDGVEILSHERDAVDLTFLKSGNAPLLDNHDRHTGLRAQLGKITDAWLEEGRVYVTVRFSSRADVAGIKQDVDDGIITNVSVGYERQKIERDEDSDEYLVTRWRPYEASFVPVPADTTVGIGRSHSTVKQEGRTMPKEELELPSVEEQVTDEQRAEAFETAVNDITALASEHNIGDIARSFIQGAAQRGETPSLAVFRGIARANIPEGTPLRNEDIGLTEKEHRTFSVRRLAAAMREGATSTDREAASFELEAVDAAAAKAEVSRGGYMLPAEVLRNWGDFEVDGVRAPVAAGTTPNVQNVDHLANRFIDNLRNRLVLGQMGVTMLTGLEGNLEIPGGDTNIAAAWLGSEDADAAESTPTFRKVEMSIKDIAVYTDMTRRMIQQSTIDIERYVRMQIVDAMAEGIDLAGFYGSGASGQPEGLANTTGIGSVTFGAAVPTRDELIDMRKEIASTNRAGSPTFVADTDMEADLMKTKVDAGSGIFLIGGDGRLHIGNTLVTSNQITSGDVFAGIWSDMLMGMWGGLELARSTEAKFLSGGIRLRAIQSVDFGVSRVGSFVLGNDG